MTDELQIRSVAGFMPDGEFAAVVVSARVITDRTGVEVTVPALLTTRGVISPLLDYCCEYSEGRSMDWLEKLCRACFLFLEFAAAHRDMSDRALLEAFAHRLHTGTFGVESALDPSWLCWRPVSRASARRTLSQLTSFFGKFEDLRNLLRPWQAPYDAAIEQAAYAHAREKAFLGHTWSMQSTRRGVGSFILSPLPKSLHVQDSEPPAFPEERFMDFLLTGWCVNGRYSYRDMLITLLLNGAGVRLSEVFHLYVTDVHMDSLASGSALVLFHHPLEGAAPEDWMGAIGVPMRGNRRTYLKERWGLEPRTMRRGAGHAGWKGAALSNQYGSKAFRAHWFVPQLGIIFMYVWERYLAELVYLQRAHPYAFVNVIRGRKGEIYKKAAFRQAHYEAVQRVGLVPSRVDGTTPHGHRHAYGRRLARAGVSGEDIQYYMHHCSFESHLVYTRPFQRQIIEALSEAAARLNGASESRQWDSFVDEVGYRMKRS